MPKFQNEIRMIWLMVLMIIGVVAWFQDIQIMSYICGIALMISLVHYVDQLQTTLSDSTGQAQLTIWSTSKVPLYVASIIAVVGGFFEITWLLGLGLTLWIFFFLRWLRRLEGAVNLISQRLNAEQFKSPDALISASSSLSKPDDGMSITTQQSSELSLMEQLQSWVFQGNPVLKVAIVVLLVGIILLLRFATEHWQLSLSMKLGIVATVSLFVTGLGERLISKNRSFALALEGLGLAGLFLTLFFAHYNLLLSSLAVASLLFGLIMLLTLWLSLRQQSIELAVMALTIAYLAPFTLPVRDATATELIAYYGVINIGVMIISTLRPWKLLNQLAFLMTIFLGGSYAFYKGEMQERALLTLFILMHLSIFVWLGFRFSQLLAQQDVQRFKLKPALDIGLIFSAPLVAYLLIYLMYFEETQWQAGISLLLAVTFAGLYFWSKRNQSIAIISQSYFSLMLIFLAFIPPILFEGQWSVMGWALEGTLIFIYALYRQSTLSQYLGMGLLTIAGLSALYYWLDLGQLPVLMFWVVALCYILVIIFKQLHPNARSSERLSHTIFLSALSLSANSMLFVLGLDYFEGSQQWIHTLLAICGFYFILNEIMNRGQNERSWLPVKWAGLVPLMIAALIIIMLETQQGVIQWPNTMTRLEYFGACLLLVGVWLRSLTGIQQEREWVSLGTLTSLGLASLTLWPALPFISVVILPLGFAIWCYLKKHNPVWTLFWTSRSTLLLLIVWIVSSQLFSLQSFQYYLMPVLNPFDLVSLAVLLSMIWMLQLQMRSGLDRGIVAILMVLSVLWLVSYILLRGLHVYYATPYNTLAVWDNALVQVSLTLLWVTLAFITMSIASRQQLRAVWILGGSILLIVTLKLVLLDLSHVGTLTRVISFLGAGFVMLMIAYIAPMPEVDHRQIEAKK